MNINGTATLQKFNIITEEFESIETVECNDICYPTIQTILTGTARANTNFPAKTPTSGVNNTQIWSIVGSSKKQKQSKLNNSIWAEWIAYATEGYPTWTPKSGIGTKDTFTVVADLLPPTLGTSRIINNIALSNIMDSNAYYANPNIIQGTLTNLLLSSPCTQTDSQVIRITYRLYFDDYVAEPVTNLSQGYYELIREMFRNVAADTTYNGYSSIDEYISGGFYNIDGLESYYHHESNTSSANYITYFYNGNIVNTNTKTKYIGCVYNEYTHDINSSYISGTFIKNLNLHGMDAEGISGSFLNQKVLPSNSSPLQNVFKHKVASNVPFQTLNVSEFSSMTGDITISTTGWIPQYLPKMFRVKVTNSGDVGVATYKFEVLDFTAGFLGNSFCPKTALMPQDPDVDKLYKYHKKSIYETTSTLSSPNSGGTVFRKIDENSLLLSVVPNRTIGSFAIYDVITGDKKVYNSTREPTFLATNISDGDVSGGFIFISCSNTGLWKINSGLTTFTRITVAGVDDTKAYQICVKDNGDLWVLFEGGLGQSTDLGTTWTIYNTTSSPVLSKTGLTNNWSNCYGMIIDPVHADDRFLFVLNTSINANDKWIWWSRTLAATNPTTGLTVSWAGIPFDYIDHIKCINNRFLININITSTPNSGLSNIEFNANNMSTVTLQYRSNSGLICKPANIAGIDGFFITSYKFPMESAIFIRSINLPTVTTSLVLSSPVIEFWVIYGASPFNSDLRTWSNEYIGGSSCIVTYFENSNLLVSLEKKTNAKYVLGVKPLVLTPNDINYSTYKPAFWKEYGWDGSGWVLGNSFSKTIHNTAEPLIDGLTISFSDGATSPNFINTDFFNFVVGDGIMKDNATTYTYGIPYYPSNTELVTIFTPSTVPATGLGLLIDEPVTFSPLSPNTANAVNAIIQQKGYVNFTDTSQYIISDQIIPSTVGDREFTLKFKINGIYSDKSLGIATYSASVYTYLYYITPDTTGDVFVKNSAGTTIATILSTNITIDSEISIIRDVADVIKVYNDATLIYTGAANTSSLSVRYFSGSSNGLYYNHSRGGFYDIKLTYVETRLISKVGNGSTTGCFKSTFTGLTIPKVVNDSYLELNAVSTITEHKTSAEAMLLSTNVKVATGAGWLIFNSADIGKTITGYFTSHYIP